MILPPRHPHQRRLDPVRPQIDRSATVNLPPARDSPHFDRFATPPWDRYSPQWLAIDDDLPADHLARQIDAAVDQLDLTALFASYAGVGSQAHRPDRMLKIVLYEMRTGRRSPAQWAKDTPDRRCLLWLGLGITPARSRWYEFRKRLGPVLDLYHRQLLEAAVAGGLTPASRGSLDGTVIAAAASRHRLLNLARLRRHLAELDRVIAADKAGQDPGADGPLAADPPPTTLPLPPGAATVGAATRPECPPGASEAARPGEDRHQHQRS